MLLEVPAKVALSRRHGLALLNPASQKTERTGKIFGQLLERSKRALNLRFRNVFL